MAALRDAGYDVPYFTGKDGTHPDALGLYAETEDSEEQKRQVLRAARASQRA